MPSAINRQAAVQFIRQSYETENMIVVPVNKDLLDRALNLFAGREDKMWGLTDCISFVVMQDKNLILAATADKHFVQAGFQALLLQN